MTVKWKWDNVPFPIQYVLALLLGLVLQYTLDGRLFQPDWVGDAVGVLLLVLGGGLVGWAVLAVGEISVADPEQLITSGPYAFSRHPMYVGWSLIYLGVSLAANSAWMAGLFPAAFGVTHFVDVKREERRLESVFGEAYLAYKENVRRYL